ncbi:hypothetical protein ACTQ49_05340 [Luteococcus sp. Sow4_B9]|uniref:hypothetical protein n=1 Tax=Luteococcus sp. Sow4_B9 TaxID=3438792 RepID=UPI003F996808
MELLTGRRGASSVSGGGQDGDGRAFAAVLSRAIKESRESLAGLQRQLDKKGVWIDLATLDYWRSGRALPTEKKDLRAVAALEVILGLGVGQLSSLVPSDAVSRWDDVRSAPVVQQLQRALDVLGLDARESLDNVFVQDTLWISEDRRRQTEHTLQVVRAARDGVQSVPIALRQRFVEEEPPLISADTGCVLRDVVKLGDDDVLLCADIRLPWPLVRGQLHTFAYTMDWTFTTPQDSYGFTRMVRDGMRHWALEAHFAQTPKHFTYYFDLANLTEDGDGSDEEVSQRMRPKRDMQVVLRDPLPGMHSVDWNF